MQPIPGTIWVWMMAGVLSLVLTLRKGSATTVCADSAGVSLPYSLINRLRQVSPTSERPAHSKKTTAIPAILAHGNLFFRSQSVIFRIWQKDVLANGRLLLGQALRAPHIRTSSLLALMQRRRTVWTISAQLICASYSTIFFGEGTNPCSAKEPPLCDPARWWPQPLRRALPRFL